MGNYLGYPNDERDLSKCDLGKRLSDIKDAVLCIGCVRFVSSFGYIGIIVLLNCYSDGFWPFLLKTLLGIIIIPELILAAILFVGAVKVLVTYYVLLFCLVHWYADGAWTLTFKFCIVCSICITISCALILYHGALNEKIWALEISIWLCLAIAAYNTVLGIVGLLYFIREGKKTMHFVIAAFFGLLAMSFFAVICHDIVIIHTLKKTISFSPVIPDLMYECC